MIKLSQDRKVQGKKGERNSFGIPAIKTCPGATESCKAVCYAKKGFFAMPIQKNFYQANYETLKLWLMTLSVEECAERFAKEIEKNNRSGIFRWNIGGDIFESKYLEMMVKIAYLLPRIRFWVYTRSFDIFINYMKGNNISRGHLPRNLSVIASYDKDNVDWRYKSNGISARDIGKYFYTVTYMGDKKAAQKAFPDRKWITCPADAGKIELQSACAKCKLCFNTKKHNEIAIHFPTTKEEGRK